MMKKLIFAIFIIFICFNAFADDVEKRRNQIISIINEELSEVERLNRQTGERNPDLLLRMAELNLEKAKLYRDKENKEFLEIPASKRRKVSQKSFFSKSSSYFSVANRLALKIARRFKSYNRLGEAYYILGFNAKEANNSRAASKYLSLATRSSRDPKTKTKTQISLAEVYYNEKEYAKAIPLYEDALRKVDDRWWTKDSFNLAWCYFRVNSYSKAISKMESIHQKSKSSKYIDMRSQVERDIGLFYATANRIDEGVRFYKNLGINFTSQLLTIAISLKEQGKYTFAQKVLNQAEKYEKNEDKLILIYIEKLVLFEKYAKYDQHLYVSKKIYPLAVKGKLSSDQISQYTFQMAKVSAILQRQVVGKTYRRVKKVRNKKADQALEYFGMLAVLDKSKSDEYRYLQAETAFALYRYSRAYEHYKDTYQYTSKNKVSSPFRIKSLDAMILTLGKFKTPSVKENIYVFEEYLKIYPRGKKSKDAYVRLFNNYKAKKDYRSASLVLDRFVKNYPNDPVQEGMIADLMEVSRKEKDYTTIRTWISAIESGKYKVSATYRRKLQELLTAIQIDDVQGQLAKGDKKSALVGYLKILDDPYATKKSKVNAKYNLAALYFELGDTDATAKWAKSALEEMDSKDVYKFSTSFVTMANFLFSSLEFKKSSELSETLVVKLCNRKTKRKNTAFKNAAFIYLADGHIKETENLVRLGQKCKVPSSYISEVEYEIMREYFQQRNWNRYEYYVLKLKDASGVYNKIIDDLLNLIAVHARFNNTQKVKQFNSILWKSYYRAKKSNDTISMRGLDYFASLKIKNMEITYNQLRLIKFEFPPEKFAALQKQKLSLLTKLTEQANDVQAVGSGVGIVNSFKLLYEAYSEVAKEVYEFTPNGKSPEYIKAFKADFNQVGKQLENAAKSYQTEAKKAIANNSILNKNNFFFQDGKLPVEFHGEDAAVLMDRGGK